MTRWRMLADAVVVFHAAYVAFVVLGFAAILAGAALGVRWARNFWFRVIHLAAITLVLVEALIGMICPLTLLEDRLRVRAGDTAYPGDFVGYWVHRLIFYDWPPWVFAVLYAGFTVAVLAAFIAVPPDFPRRRVRPR
ncbi:MAG: DUF2784 domain-containing protein [Candidatus Binataceae bacterium]